MTDKKPQPTYLDITQKLRTHDGKVVDMPNHEMMLIPDLLDWSYDRLTDNCDNDFEADDVRAIHGWLIKPTKDQLDFIRAWNAVPLKPNKCKPMTTIQDWEKPFFAKIGGKKEVEELRKVVADCGLFYLVRRCDVFLGGGAKASSATGGAKAGSKSGGSKPTTPVQSRSTSPTPAAAPAHTPDKAKSASGKAKGAAGGKKSTSKGGSKKKSTSKTGTSGSKGKMGKKK
jgi:hypothetical protein